MEWRGLLLTGLIVQPGLIDAAIIHPIGAWIDRYLMICSSGETAYHILIEKLLHGIVRLVPIATPFEIAENKLLVSASFSQGFCNPTTVHSALQIANTRLRAQILHA